MIFRRPIIVLTTLLANSLAFATEGWETIPLQEAGFEAPLRGGPWRATQHAGIRAYRFEPDSEHKTEGKQSLRIERHAEQVFGSVAQTIRGIAPGKYRLSADMRSKEVTGEGWYLRVVVTRGTQGFQTPEVEKMKGNTDWKRKNIEFDVPEDTTALTVGVTLEGGGTGWIDNVKLEKRK
jgi:hypothetical protein